jgi:hypothetical protein
MVLGVRLRFGFAMPPFCENRRPEGRSVDRTQAAAVLMSDLDNSYEPKPIQRLQDVVRGTVCLA